VGFFDFLNGIGSALSAIAQAISSLFVWLWQVTQALFVFLWNVLAAVFQWTLAGLAKIGQFFRRFWTDYIRRGLRGLLDLYKRIRDRLALIFGPIIRWLQKVRAWFDAHILPVLKKYLQLIQRIRQFLVILRVFNVRWAKELDNYLARVQGKITLAIDVIRGTLNQIINTLALIVDPDLIIRRNMLGASLLAHLGALKRIVGYGSNRILTSDEADKIERNKNRYKASVVDEHLQELHESGPTEEDKARRQTIRRQLKELTGLELRT
jgi:hypothetical protein